MRIPTRETLLAWLLILNAAILMVLGAALLLAPGSVESAFGFRNMPREVAYVLAMWGCVSLTMGFGYSVAAVYPYLRPVWVQVAVGRGAVECLAGVVLMARGVVEFRQAGFGTILSALIAIAYLLVYPRSPPIPLSEKREERSEE